MADPLADRWVQYFQNGQLPCKNCGRLIPLENLTALENIVCPDCNTTNLIPMKISNFWLFEALAVGGMGAVYKALHSGDFEKYYAVKILPRRERDNLTLIENLKDEINIMNDIGYHSSTIYAVEAGCQNDEYFIASQYIRGQTLEELIRKGGKLSEEVVVLSALRILAALTHIFNKGYLYRDLKPENIILRDQHQAFLCDFGICMKIGKAHLYDGDIIQGSPFYIPPERLLGEGEYTYSEIYSLGLVMYHSLVGEPFYTADHVEEVARLHVESIPEDLFQHKLTRLNPEIAEVIGKMIRRAPKDRYQTYLNVESDLFRIFSSRTYSQ